LKRKKEEGWLRATTLAKMGVPRLLGRSGMVEPPPTPIPLLLLLLLFQFYCFIILNYFLKIFILFIYLFYIVPHVNLSG
jgi:hypothetical protein